MLKVETLEAEISDDKIGKGRCGFCVAVRFIFVPTTRGMTNTVIANNFE